MGLEASEKVTTEITDSRKGREPKTDEEKEGKIIAQLVMMPNGVVQVAVPPDVDDVMVEKTMLLCWLNLHRDIERTWVRKQLDPLREKRVWVPEA